MTRIYLILGLAVLSACGASRQKEEEYVPSWEESEYVSEDYYDEGYYDESSEEYEDYEEWQPEKLPYHASRTLLTDLVHTKLEVRFDWAASRMNGVATITAKPHFHPSDSLFLDAKGMEIKKVSQNGAPLTYNYDGMSLRIKLNKVYTRNDKYTVVIDYVAKPEERETGGSEAITSDKGLYFINPKGDDKTRMPQIWTQGETEANSVWFPTIDAPNVKTTQETFITVDQKYVTLSNGKLVKSVKNTDGTRTDYWKQDLPHAPYLFMMGVGEFKIVKDFYTRPDGTKMEVNYYVEPEWEASAKAIFGETPAMIRYFSQLTGVEYPWDKYHQIVVRDYVSGAMENTGAVVFGDFVYKTGRELIDEDDHSTIAHELFHNWFGDLVTCESWSNLPLNESFANYSQYLWDEHRYGIDEADFNAETEAEGYYSAASMNHNLIWFDYESQEQMFDAHSYNKGGRILHMLRNYLGDEVFFAGLKNYLTTNKFKAAEYTHLRLALEEVSGEDLNWFFNQWFLASGHPVLSVEQEYFPETGEVTVTVSQNQDNYPVLYYRLPVEIAVYDDAGEHLHKVEVLDQYSTSFTFPVTGTLKTVIFDNQQVLLANVEDLKPEEQLVQQYYLGKRYKNRKLALEGFSGSPEMEKMVLDALKDPFWKIRELAVMQASSLTERLEEATDIIATLATTDEKSQVRAAAVSFLAEYAPTEKAEPVLTDRLDNDRSYLVIGTALTNLGAINSELAMTKAKALENEPSSKIRSGIAQLYATQGGADAFPFFEKLMNSNDLKGYDAIFALNSFTIFMSRQDAEMQTKIVKLYRKQYETGNMYIKMFMPQNVSYMMQSISESQEKMKASMLLYEKNHNAEKANQLRKAYSIQQMTLKELEGFSNEIEGLESGEGLH